MRRKGWFWAAVALQVLVLLGMVGVHGYTLATGHPVLLKSVPIDPWDPLRGQYVTLGYDISRLQPAKIPMAGSPYERGQEIWVVLQPGNPYWTAVSVSNQRPAVTAEQVAMKGRVDWWNPGYESQPAEALIRYGIEQFYVPEGQGTSLEQGQRAGELSVEVLVDPTGRAAMHRVFLNGQEVHWR
jgi:uncharacterized membrane-anchored protein